MKHAHWLFAALTVLVFLGQVYWVWASKPMPNNKLPKAFTIGSHIVYTGVVAFGLALLIKLPVLPYWLLAKIVLFAVMMSASFKAFRASTTLAQRKTGLFVASVALAGLLMLVWLQPNLGMIVLHKAG